MNNVICSNAVQSIFNVVLLRNKTDNNRGNNHLSPIYDKWKGRVALNNTYTKPILIDLVILMLIPSSSIIWDPLTIIFF